jgi:cyclase
VEHLAPDIWTERVVAEGFPTVSAVIVTPGKAFVVDTLSSPQAVQPIVGLLRQKTHGQRAVVINTHHHWDHVYGNAAFHDVDIVAHRACPRLMVAQRSTANESVPHEPPEGVPLPNVTFSDRLTFAADPETLHLIPAPGHTTDSIVVYVVRAGVLFAGDVLEWPLPSFSDRDAAETWVKSLRQLKQLSVDLVVPAHGAPRPKSLIDDNERYIVEVYEAVAAAKQAGAGRHELDLPAARFVPEAARVDAVYEASHASNLLHVWDEV